MPEYLTPQEEQQDAPLSVESEDELLLLEREFLLEVLHEQLELDEEDGETVKLAQDHQSHHAVPVEDESVLA